MAKCKVYLPQLPTYALLEHKKTVLDAKVKQDCKFSRIKPYRVQEKDSRCSCKVDANTSSLERQQHDGGSPGAEVTELLHGFSAGTLAHGAVQACELEPVGCERVLNHGKEAGELGHHNTLGAWLLLTQLCQGGHQGVHLDISGYSDILTKYTFSRAKSLYWCKY